MIKHWRLFETITAQQIQQLHVAGIFVRIEEDVSEIEFPLAGKVQFLKGQDIYISTSKDSQDTLLRMMFPNTIKLLQIEFPIDEE